MIGKSKARFESIQEGKFSETDEVSEKKKKIIELRSKHSILLRLPDITNESQSFVIYLPFQGGSFN
jgi:hypothetical protein